MNCGGTQFTHNCLSLDYCIKESLASLQACCNEIVIVDAESTDGTKEWLQQQASYDPRIRIYHEKWMPAQDGKGAWLADLGNKAREKLQTPYHLSLQADEVIHEEDYWCVQSASIIGSLFLVSRLNFWKDAHHLVPHGKICGHNITRMGPTKYPFVGDAENIEQSNSEIAQSKLRIFHYGFLRKDQAQKEKGISMEGAFFGQHNPVFDRMDAEGRKPFDDQIEDSELIPYNGTHPALAMSWLKERGRL